MTEQQMQALADLDLSRGMEALALHLNQCPTCGGHLVAGTWLKWCQDRRCTQKAMPK